MSSSFLSPSKIPVPPGTEIYFSVNGALAHQSYTCDNE